jgi:predicted DNA-binding transcriptional regulator AlpA
MRSDPATTGYGAMRMNERIRETLDPHQIIRRREGRKYFGLGLTQIDEKIKKGEIPKPIALSDSGRATGWTGRQIIEHQARLVAAAAKQDLV